MTQKSAVVAKSVHTGKWQTKSVTVDQVFNFIVILHGPTLDSVKQPWQLLNFGYSAYFMMQSWLGLGNVAGSRWERRCPSEQMIQPDAQGHQLARQGATKWQLCLTSRSFESPTSFEMTEVSLQHPELPNICSLDSICRIIVRSELLLPDLIIIPVWWLWTTEIHKQLGEIGFLSFDIQATFLF